MKRVINNGRNYIHSFNKYLLSVGCVPGTVTGVGDTSGKKMGKVCPYPELIFQTGSGVVGSTQVLELECLDLEILLWHFNVTLNKSLNLSEPQFIHV